MLLLWSQHACLYGPNHDNAYPYIRVSVEYKYMKKNRPYSYGGRLPKWERQQLASLRWIIYLSSGHVCFCSLWPLGSRSSCRLVSVHSAFIHDRLALFGVYSSMHTVYTNLAYMTTMFPVKLIWYVRCGVRVQMESTESPLRAIHGIRAQRRKLEGRGVCLKYLTSPRLYRQPR